MLWHSSSWMHTQLAVGCHAQGLTLGFTFVCPLSRPGAQQLLHVQHALQLCSCCGRNPPAPLPA
jgi:hypothetical protein